jgi:hypothetical protein
MKSCIPNAARTLSAITIMAGLMLFGTSAGSSQQKAAASAKQLVGTWTLVFPSTTLPDGKKVQALVPIRKACCLCSIPMADIHCKSAAPAAPSSVRTVAIRELPRKPSHGAGVQSPLGKILRR